MNSFKLQVKQPVKGQCVKNVSRSRNQNPCTPNSSWSKNTDTLYQNSCPESEIVPNYKKNLIHGSRNQKCTRNVIYNIIAHVFSKVIPYDQVSEEKWMPLQLLGGHMLPLLLFAFAAAREWSNCSLVKEGVSFTQFISSLGFLTKIPRFMLELYQGPAWPADTASPRLWLQLD